MDRMTDPERRHHWPMRHAIAVRLSLRRITRMKIICRWADEEHAQVGAEISVDRVSQFMWIDVALEYHVRHLTFGVNPRISAPRSVHRDFTAIEQRKDSS